MDVTDLDVLDITVDDLGVSVDDLGVVSDTFTANTEPRQGIGDAVSAISE